MTRDLTCLPFPTEGTEWNLLIALAPHVRRALDISRRLANSRAFEESLNSLPVGVIFTAPDARLVWWNRYAAEILQARDGLSAAPDGLRMTAGSGTKSLDQFIREVVEGDVGEEHSLCIPRRSMRRPYAILISKLKLGGGLMGDAATIVLVTDPERKLPSGTDVRLANQFGLTPAEGRVAAAMASGRTVEEAADELSIGIATVRTHVRRILLKTGAAHQAGLVRTLLTSPFLAKFESV